MPEHKSPNVMTKLLSMVHRHTAGVPEIIIHAEDIAQNMVNGGHRQRKHGSGEYFWQYREYDNADRPQDIDWRQSGKSDRLYVRQKELQTAQTNLFWCQTNSAMDFKSQRHSLSKKHEALILTLALASLIKQAEERIQPLYAGQARSVQLEPLAYTLHEPNADALPQIGKCHIPQNANIILTADFLSPIEDIEQCFQSLKHKGKTCIIIQVLDPAELTLPYKGRILFENEQALDRTLIDNVQSVRAEYQSRIKKHIQDIKDRCHYYGFQYLLHATDQDIAASLLSLRDLVSKERAVK